MAEKQWRPLDDDCMYCGGQGEAFTDSGHDNVASDGDAARCSECGCPGQVIVDEDDFPHAYAYISWHDERGCQCEWCRKQEGPGDD